MFEQLTQEKPFDVLEVQFTPKGEAHLPICLVGQSALQKAAERVGIFVGPFEGGTTLDHLVDRSQPPRLLGII